MTGTCVRGLSIHRWRVSSAVEQALETRGIPHGLGDQTAFSAGAVIAPANWSRLVRLLPCEWNWQTCVWSYGRAHECPLYEGRLNKTRLAEQGYENLNCSHQPLLHDGSCSRPPRLLHLDCPGDLKALLDISRRHGIWILADEIYALYHFAGGRAPSFPVGRSRPAAASPSLVPGASSTHAQREVVESMRAHSNSGITAARFDASASVAVSACHA